MADFFGAAGDLLGGVGGLFGGLSAAQGDREAAKFYFQAAQYSQLETGLKETALNRSIYQTLGQGRADIAASGIENSGSAAAVMRSSAQQGAISKALTELQGKIDYSSYEAQGNAAEAQGQAAEGGGIGSLIGGAVGALGMIFSDDTMKDDVKLVYRRDDGIGLYTFRYRDSTELFYGVLAGEVEKVDPEAVLFDQAGFRRVDYERIAMPFGILREAA